MDKNATYWLNRVAVKLHQLHFKGVDYKIEEHRWLFDWKEDLGIEENLLNVEAEDRALNVFSQSGVIKSQHIANFYRIQQLESFADPLRGHVIWGSWDEFDPPLREYNYLRILDSINWEMFLVFCADYKLNYKEDVTMSSLEIINQVPMIHAGDKTYVLKTLQNGTPLDIIQVAYDHPDIRFGFEELRRWTNKNFVAQKRFTDIFRKGKNEFSRDSLLSPFADITAHTFILKKDAQLSPSQLEAIQKSSTN